MTTRTTKMTVDRAPLSIVFHEMRSDVQESLQTVLSHPVLAVLVPDWVGQLNVYYESIDGQAFATAGSSMEYARTQVTVCPEWMNQNADFQWSSAIHEICHAHVFPVQDFAKKLLDMACQETPEVRAIMEAELQARVEMAATSIERAIVRALMVWKADKQRTPFCEEK